MARRKSTGRKQKTEKKVTRYTYDEIKESCTPETGHTPLLPGEDLVAGSVQVLAGFVTVLRGA